MNLKSIAIAALVAFVASGVVVEQAKAINLPTVGRQLWLDGSDPDGDGNVEGAGESGISGATVTWADKSGNGRHFTQSTSIQQPVYSSTGFLNSKGAFDFNYLEGDFLSFAGGPLPAGDDDYTIVAVWRSISPPGAQFIFDQTGPDTSNKRAGLLILPDSTMGYNGNVNDAHSMAPHVSGSTYMVTMQLDNNNRFGVPAGPNVRLEVRDNVMVSPSLHTATTTDPSTLDVGNQVTYLATPNGVQEFFNGMIAEIVVYDRLLTTNELTTVRNYMNQKYMGEAVPEPSSFVLAGLGLVGLAGWGLRRRRMS